MDPASEPTDLTHLEAERPGWLGDRWTTVAGGLPAAALGMAPARS